MPAYLHPGSNSSGPHRSAAASGSSSGTSSNANSATALAKQAISRLAGIGGLAFEAQDLELVRSLRATRNAIEHYAWATTKREAEAIVGKAQEFAIHFAKAELQYDFIGYQTRKDDTLSALISANQTLASALARRVFPSSAPDTLRPEDCAVCGARAVDPVTHACRLCGHWGAADDAEIPF